MTLQCGNCRQPMRPLVLDAHYGGRLEIDICAGCHLVWFDNVEAARLTGPSMLVLLRTFAAAQREPHRLFQAGQARCPRCSGPLKLVHNRSRWGATLQHECQRQHGANQSFAMFLSEKGLLRPLGPADRAALLERGGDLTCLNCGAGMGASDPECSHCGSTPALFDVARLARALDPEDATVGHAVRQTGARREMPQCLACGAPMAVGQSVSCLQCGATLAVGRLGEALDAVGPLEQALREHQASPAPHVKARRLARLQSDLDRRRAFNQEMEASTQADRTPGGWDVEVESTGRFAAATRVIGAIALALLLWSLFGS